MQWFCRGVLAVGIMLATPSLGLGNFVDTFESDTAGSFPASWTHFAPGGPNSEVIVVDDALDPGAVHDGQKSARLTFTGGYGSGILTTVDPLQQGVVEFFSRVENFSERLQLLGLFTLPDTEAPGSHVGLVQVKKSSPNYIVKGAVEVDTGVPIVFGEYVEFDLHFDVVASTLTLYINDVLSNAVDVPFDNPSAGVTTLRSNHITDVGGNAQWYLDNVSLVPEPSTLCMLSLGSLTVLRRRRVGRG